jgi:hypothetical protein
MATVTPNFNWPVPTSTDLVKDGATAIEALGDSIDASLLDLKGGTTGQVLSKTSGTDMDFTWVTSDDANAIQNSIVDAKGDLIAATANDTPARLAVGANGTMLVANSAESTGLKWTTATDQYPWQTWSPTYSNLTIGNGTVTARYQQIGKTVNVFWRLVFGSTTTFTAYPQIGLPVVNSSQTKFFTGAGYFEDAGITAYTGVCYVEGSNRFQVLLSKTNGTYSESQFLTSTSVPFTWGTSDEMAAFFSYEAA